MATENSPRDKPLETASFVVHATRGLIRDQNTRRKAMLILLVAALFLMVAGSTLLQSVLAPHDHPGRFIFFWVVCAWVTLTAILLAIFDLLMVRNGAAREQRALRKKIEAGSSKSGDHR